MNVSTLPLTSAQAAAAPEMSVRSPTIRVHRTQEEIEAIRPFWVRQQSRPNSDIDHYLLVCRLRPQVISPYVISVWDGSDCRAVIAGRLERAHVRPSIGYLRLPGIAVRQVSVLYDGVIGVLTQSEANLVLAEIAAAGTRGEVDLIVFSSLPEQALFWNTTLKGRSRQPELWSEHWHLRLPGEPGFLLRSMKSKHRSWAKRKATEFEAAFAGRHRWIWTKTIDDVGTLCRQLETVASQTYQRGLGAGFKDDVLHRERLGLFARDERLRVMMLEIDGKLAAFWYGVVYRGTFYSEATGYVPELRDFEIGTQLFLRIVDELVGETVTAFDFGLGDAAYKKRFGDRSWREAELRVFGPGWRANVIRGYLALCEQTNVVLRRTLVRLGLVDRIKTAWRKRLARHPAAADKSMNARAAIEETFSDQAHD